MITEVDQSDELAGRPRCVYCIIPTVRVRAMELLVAPGETRDHRLECSLTPTKEIGWYNPPTKLLLMIHQHVSEQPRHIVPHLLHVHVQVHVHTRKHKNGACTHAMFRHV